MTSDGSPPDTREPDEPKVDEHTPGELTPGELTPGELTPGELTPGELTPDGGEPKVDGPGPDGTHATSAERTRLAWRRTVLATTAVAVLTIRLAVREGLTPLRALVIAGAVAAWLAQLWITQRRIRAMADPSPGGIGRTLPFIALVTAGYAAVGVALLVTG